MSKDDRPRCAVCGKLLKAMWVPTGRCAEHLYTTLHNDSLDAVAKAAKAAGMSYGQYVSIMDGGRSIGKGK